MSPNFFHTQHLTITPFFTTVSSNVQRNKDSKNNKEYNSQENV